MFNYDPLPSDESSSLDLVSSLEAALVDYASDKAKLNDVAGTVSIPPLEPMSQTTLPVEITFRTGETTRL